MKRKMLKYAKELQFEKAALIRDKIKIIEETCDFSSLDNELEALRVLLNASQFSTTGTRSKLISSASSLLF